LLEHITKRLESLLSYENRDITYLCVNGSVEGGTTTFIAYVPNSTIPQYIVKVLRNSNNPEKLKNEHSILKELNSCKELFDSIPEILLVDMIDGIWYSVQTYLTGKPLEGYEIGSIKSGVLKSFNNSSRMIGNLLINIYNHSRSNKASNVINHIDLLAKDIDDFGALYDIDTKQRFIMNNLLVWVRTIKPHYVSVSHNDLNKHNILLNDGASKGVRIIDWTDSTPFGSPIYDMLNYYSTLLYPMKAMAGIESMVEMFKHIHYENNVVHASIYQQLQSLMKVLGYSPKDLKYVLGVFLIKKTMWDYRRLKSVSKYKYIPGSNKLESSHDISYNDMVKNQLFYHYYIEYCKQVNFI
jgi:hypothetical protein